MAKMIATPERALFFDAGGELQYDGRAFRDAYQRPLD